MANEFFTQQPNEYIRRQRESQETRFLQFPLEASAHSILMVFNKYAFVSPGEGGLNRLTAGSARNRGGRGGPIPSGQDVIQLPIPANIQDNYSLRVQGNDLGFAAGEVANAASAFAGAGDLTAGNLASVLRQALPDVDISSIFNSDLGQISRNISFLGRRTIDSTLPGAGRAVDQGLGNTVNPKSSLYFEGVNLKQFDFNWTLAPTESSESDRIRDITNTIKRHVLPTYGSAVGLNRILLNYPSTVDIFFLGVEDSYFVYFKRCMVQQFSVNYTPNGLTFVSGGKPAMVNVNMTLMEMDIHTAEDYGGAGSTFEVATEGESIAPAIVPGEAS